LEEKLSSFEHPPSSEGNTEKQMRSDTLDFWLVKSHLELSLGRFSLAELNLHSPLLCASPVTRVLSRCSLGYKKSYEE
jgi:hypothetical protein